MKIEDFEFLEKREEACAQICKEWTRLHSIIDRNHFSEISMLNSRNLYVFPSIRRRYNIVRRFLTKQHSVDVYFSFSAYANICSYEFNTLPDDLSMYRRITMLLRSNGDGNKSMPVICLGSYVKYEN